MLYKMLFNMIVSRTLNISVVKQVLENTYCFSSSFFVVKREASNNSSKMFNNIF